MSEISLNAYAKINLHLDITGRRENGYHTVNTVMQSVSLCDRVTVSGRKEEGIFLTCDVPMLPTDRKNLAYRAAEAYLEENPHFVTDVGKGVSVHIAKRIPVSAGLAGGSTDAAAVLLGMNAITSAPLPMEELLAVGARLGADVPFCMVGGTRFADGIGTELHDFPPLPDCHLVVACGGEAVSTPWAYGMLDERYEFFSDGAYAPRSLDSLKEALLSNSIGRIAASTFNLFEEVVLPYRPVAQTIRQSLLEQGAIGAMMSGSGPSVFGIFENRGAASAARSALVTLGVSAFVCEPISLISLL